MCLALPFENANSKKKLKYFLKINERYYYKAKYLKVIKSY
jgi:hypothetical protein